MAEGMTERDREELALRDFEARLPWVGADLQTLRNFLRRPGDPLGVASRERHRVALDDGSGDALALLVERPEVTRRVPVALLHGLGGCEDSAYMRTSAAALLARGHPVVRVNLRGAGPSAESCRLLYHAGRSADVRAVVAALRDLLACDSVALVGYSLGGNVLLKLLGEGVEGVAAAASVSAPIDLASASARIRERRNWMYERYLLRRIKADALGGPAPLSAAERRAVEGARSVFDFDDAFVAPRNGWRDAAEYYAVNSSEAFLGRIRVPTLVVHAMDDPWIPGTAYGRVDWGANRALTPALVRGGGHVGFHARGSRVPWHDRAIAAFLEARGL